MRDQLLSGRRFVVTGGCGFIGGHLVDHLLRIPRTEVVVVDDCRFGNHRVPDAAGRYSLVQHRLGPESHATLKECLRADDIVFHLAAEKLHQSHDDQISLLHSNVDGTWRVLEAAAHARAGRFIGASSLYAHGRMSGPPLREDDLPQPTTVYGVTKLSGEHLLQSIRRTMGLKGLALRFFFTYGPRQYAGKGYPSVIVKNFERLAQGKPPTICGDGEQALDYIYVDDVVRALVLAAESDLDGEVLNIGSGRAVSILELTRAMQKVAATDFVPEFIVKDFTAGSCRQADITRASEKLGFTAEVPLEKGLASTWAWLKKDWGT
jgi:UDP-glucose 4-epimerase